MKARPEIVLLKMFGQINFWLSKIFGPKESFGQAKFLLLQTILLVQSIFYPQIFVYNRSAQMLDVFDK